MPTYTSQKKMQVGAKYELENEEELKDKLDFMQPLSPAPFLGTICSV